METSKAPKTQKLTDDQMRRRFKEGSPCCGAVIAMRTKKRVDENTGRRREIGSFFGCSNKSCRSGYYLSWNGTEKIVDGTEQVAA